MSIADAPFVGIAVPVKFSPISKAYWQSDASVEDIAIRFSLKNGRHVTKRAGKAILKGIPCKHCGKDIEVKGRGHAITEINTFRKSSKFNRVECDPCFQNIRKSRFMAKPVRGRSSTDAEIAKKAAKLYGPTPAEKDEFYKSWEWRTLRMEVIKQHGRNCQCCGAAPGDLDMSGRAVRIVVDHIKPISKFWGMRLDRSNLQVLCDECNQGKGNWDETDFRKPAAPDEWLIDGEVDSAILHQLTDLTTGRLQ